MRGDEKPYVSVSYTFKPDAKERLEEVLSPLARIVYLPELSPAERSASLQKSRVLLALAPHQELTQSEDALLTNIDFLQLLSAGADHLKFDRLPAHLTVASNIGAYAKPMAEHVLAMVLALSKKLMIHHKELKQGIFDQKSENKALAGATAAIVGFGGIGREVARLFKAFGMRVLAINRSGKSPEPVDFIGTQADLGKVLTEADVIVITLPLNRSSRGLIGAAEFKLMKPDAVLVNVGRGEVIDEGAFYQHLKETPTFMAGIDAWWVEPVRHGCFAMNYPFLSLPNVLGSPHNSALTAGSLAAAAQKAAENIRRFLLGEPLVGIVNRADYDTTEH